MAEDGRIPLRTVRVPDALWDAAKEKAAQEETTVSAVIVAGLRRYIKRPSRAGA